MSLIGAPEVQASSTSVNFQPLAICTCQCVDALRQNVQMQVLPVSMSVTAFHFFQLTELSTVFLHISWMASKSQVQYFYLFSVLISLLVTFAIRLVTTAYIVFHVVTRVVELRLWEVCTPSQASFFYQLLSNANKAQSLPKISLICWLKFSLCIH